METARPEWKNYGFAHEWPHTPERVKAALCDPDAIIIDSSHGNGVTEYYCEKYRFTYKVDSKIESGQHGKAVE